MDNEIRFTHFKNFWASDANDKGGVNHLSGTWDELINDFMIWNDFTCTNTTDYTGFKNNFNTVIWGEMVRGEKRHANHVIAMYVLPLDIDDGATYDEVRELLKDYEYFLYSTSSTGLKSGDRFRVLLPLNEPISRDEWFLYSDALKVRFRMSDDSFAKSLQLQNMCYRNTVYQDQFIMERHHGKWFSMKEELIPLPAAVSAKVSFVRDVNYVRDNTYTSSDEIEELINLITDNGMVSDNHDLVFKLSHTLRHLGLHDQDIINVLSRCTLYHDAPKIVSELKQPYFSMFSIFEFIKKGSYPSILKKFTVEEDIESENTDYDQVFDLAQDEYITDINSQLKFTDGFNLLIADVGTGKTETAIRNKCYFLSPLKSIVSSVNANPKLSDECIVMTWNGFNTAFDAGTVDHTMTVYVDEAHILIHDYSYRSPVFNQFIRNLRRCKRVVFMSGTVRKENFIGIEFERCIRVSKRSKCEKIFKTYICQNRNDILRKIVDETKNKVIVLLNKKTKAMTISEKLIGKKSIIVNSDTTDDEAVIKMFQDKEMGDIDVIFCTNTMREGQSIEDELDEAEIVIWDNLNPDLIEQMVNRFRNIKVRKIVHYIIQAKLEEPDDEPELNVESLIQGAKQYAEIQNATQKIITDPVILQSIRNEYSQELKGQSISYFSNDGLFDVNYLKIASDVMFSTTKELNTDFNRFAQALCAYSYQVHPPLLLHGNGTISRTISQEERHLKQSIEADRIESLYDLKNDIIEHTTKSDMSDNETYSSAYTGIVNLLEKGGLHKSDMIKIVDGLMMNPDYIRLCWLDSEYNYTGNSIRDLIKNQIKYKSGTDLVSVNDVQTLSESIVSKVLHDFFKGDREAMALNPEWKSEVILNGNELEIINKRHVAVLRKYVTVGDGSRPRVNGIATRHYSVPDISFTGIQFTAPKL